jgi:hypothetical protein
VRIAIMFFCFFLLALHVPAELWSKPSMIGEAFRLPVFFLFLPVLRFPEKNCAPGWPESATPISNSIDP